MDPRPPAPPVLKKVPPTRALIIGAGVSGLAAALRLAEGKRWKPLVLERDTEPGGLARSLHFRGVSTDLGPHRIHTEIPEVAALIERIAAPSLITVQRSSHIYLRGRFLRYPPSPLAMARSLGFFRMAGFSGSYALGKLTPAPKRETYESLMIRAFGRQLYKFLLEPYSAKTWKIDPAELHADTARVRVSAGSLAKMLAGLMRGRRGEASGTALREFRYVRGGAETLVRHLLEHASQFGTQLRLSAPVASLELDDRGTIRAARVDKPGGERVASDCFLSTIPLPLLLGRLLPASPALADAREAVLGLRYLDMIFVALIVRRKIISGDNWLYFPEPEFIFNRAYEAKNFDPEMGPEDRSVLCLEITLRPGDAVWRESDEHLITQVTRQVASTGLFAENELEAGFVYRLPFAYPLYTLDYAERLDRVLKGLRQITNLLTLGRQGLFNHNNMDHSIWMGLRAANILNESDELPTAVARWYDEAPAFRNIRIVD